MLSVMSARQSVHRLGCLHVMPWETSSPNPYGPDKACSLGPPTHGHPSHTHIFIGKRAVDLRLKGILIHSFLCVRIPFWTNRNPRPRLQTYAHSDPLQIHT